MTSLRGLLLVFPRHGPLSTEKTSPPRFGVRRLVAALGDFTLRQSGDQSPHSKTPRLCWGAPAARPSGGLHSPPTRRPVAALQKPGPQPRRKAPVDKRRRRRFDPAPATTRRRR